jgi:hypothetical protein
LSLKQSSNFWTLAGTLALAAQQRRQSSLESRPGQRAHDPVDLATVAQDDQERDRARLEAGGEAPAPRRR